MEAEALRWNGGVYVEPGSTEYDNGRRLLGMNLRFLRECNLERRKSKKEDSTEEDEMKQQQRRHERYDEENQIKRKNAR